MTVLTTYTRYALVLCMLFLIIYTFTYKGPTALAFALLYMLFYVWLIFISFNAVLYTQIAPMKKECEKQLTRIEKCVFIAVPENSIAEEIEEI